MVNGQQSTVNGQQSIVNGQQSIGLGIIAQSSKLTAFLFKGLKFKGLKVNGQLGWE